MQDGKSPGEVNVIKEWLRRVRNAHQFLDFDFQLSDGTLLRTCLGSSDRFQLYKCVEHIAYILQLSTIYHSYEWDGKKRVEVSMQFEGCTYFQMLD